MKKSELIFNVLLVPLDFLLILAAAAAAYFLRYQVETLPVLFELTFQQYLKLIIFAIPFLQGLFALSGLYTQKSTRSFLREAARVVTAVSAGLMIVVVLFFFNRNLFPSRLIVLMGWAFAIAAVCFGRGLMLLLERQLLAKGIGRHRLAVIEGASAPRVIREIESDSKLGYEIVARLRYSPESLRRIEELHHKPGLDELMQADPHLPSEGVLALVELCENLGIKFNYLPNILESHRANVETDVIANMPVIRLRPTPLDGWGKVVKRGLDIVVAGAGIALFSPLFALIALIIKLDSRGPVFFHQRRGSSFNNFEFYKFRSMHRELSEGTERGDLVRRRLEERNARHGPYVKIKNDPRVTRIGRLLRRTKLDELPQLWHVLLGQMSLVGPRIHMTREVEKFEQSHKRLFTIRPGLTGLAQLQQFRNPELAFEDEVKLDLFYIENWSVWLDLYIVFKTFVLLLAKRPEADY